MPELPEVERFRQALLPLVSKTETLQLTRMSLENQPPRKFLSDDEISKINQGNFRVSGVIRKGKQLCLILKSRDKTQYLFAHMGMTGHISAPNYTPKLKEVKPGESFPPAYTYLVFSTGKYEASFSDPRKFGHVLLKTSLDDFDELAPDALDDLIDQRPLILKKVANQSAGIKGILLDQKRCVSGVGNWVADEVLYQFEMHPDQAHLTTAQAGNLLDMLYEILNVAVNSLKKDEEFPKDWLFHYRWNKKKTTKDAKGRTVTFVTSGGRTSAIAPSIQKKKSQKPTITTKGQDLEKTKKRRAAKQEEGATLREDSEHKATQSPKIKARKSTSSRASQQTKKRKAAADESYGNQERLVENPRRSRRLRS
jgi:formamidopyrimidine-DNA glycosylase